MCSPLLLLLLLLVASELIWHAFARLLPDLSRVLARLVVYIESQGY